jgi:membrane protease YdiL (CAAX protease family)
MMDNPELAPNPDNPFDLSAYGITSLEGFTLMIIPFVLGAIALLFLMKPVHERPMLSVVTSHLNFRWKRFFWGAGIWFVLLATYAFVASITGIQKVELQFDQDTFFALIILSLLLLPFQTAFEEILFRGYLMQGFALLFKYRWAALLTTSLLFGGLHFFNPEVAEFGAWITMPQYIWFGLFFGVCALMDEGLELAWGVHAINNIFLSVIFTQDSSALQTPALYKITDFDPAIDLLVLFILTLIFVFWASRKFGWDSWRYLFAKIDPPKTLEDEEADYPQEYDEYENEEQ